MRGRDYDLLKLPYLLERDARFRARVTTRLEFLFNAPSARLEVIAEPADYNPRRCRWSYLATKPSRCAACERS